MTRWPFDPPQAVHIVSVLDATARKTAIAGGAAVFELDLAPVVTDQDLLDLFNKTFTLPYPARSIDAAIDLLTDPLTDEHAPGYLVSVTGCDGAGANDVLSVLADIAPFVAERSRTIDIPYVWMFEAVSARDTVLEAARVANAILDKGAVLDEVPLTNSGSIALFVDGVEVSAT